MTDEPETTDIEDLLDKRNVIAVSYDTDTVTVDVWVSQKLPLHALDEEDVVANGVPSSVGTDVHDAGLGEEADGFTPELLPATGLAAHADRHARHRPVLPGVSEININSTAATAGHYPARVTDTSKGEWADSVSEGDHVRIANCHSYARSGQAPLGEPVVQPSSYDGGDEEDTTGGLVGYLPLEDSVRADVAARSIDREQDAAEPHEMAADWPTDIRRTPPQTGETLTKTGRTTGVTTGTVLASAASVRVKYPHGVVTLREQLLTEAMSEGGDSGSPVYDEQGRLVAQLFAGSPKITAHNRIDTIESDFGIQLMSSEPNDHEPEQTFEDWLKAQMEEEYGAENVHQQYRFPDGRRADLIHVLADEVRVFELENDSGSVVNGAGQALYYALQAEEEWDNAEPWLGVPAGHIEDIEREVIRRMGVNVAEFDLPDDVSLEGV